MLRFLLLRFLPRRLLPLLMLYELYRLVIRVRRHDEPGGPEPRTIRGHATVAPATEDAIR